MYCIGKILCWKEDYKALKRWLYRSCYLNCIIVVYKYPTTIVSMVSPWFKVCTSQHFAPISVIHGPHRLVSPSEPRPYTQI